MVRISKQQERRHKCPKKRKAPSKKTGPKTDNIPGGFRVHLNALEGQSTLGFIPKIK